MPTPDIAAFTTIVQGVAATVNPNSAMTWAGPLLLFGGLFLVVTVGTKWAPKLLRAAKRMM